MGKNKLTSVEPASGRKAPAFTLMAEEVYPTRGGLRLDSDVHAAAGAALLAELMTNCNPRGYAVPPRLEVDTLSLHDVPAGDINTIGPVESTTPQGEQ